ncbi:MAG: electron transfer flavoprotein subunit beta/FixA family protein [Bacteroidota bacterium]
MNILVCLSQVPDTTTKIVFSSDNKSLNKTGVQYIINPYDELALTKALELNEATGGGSVTVIHVGGADAEPVLRKALAIGADEAVRVDAEPLDSRQVAAELSAWIQEHTYDLVLAGRESIDYNSGLVGGMLSQYLDWPLVNIATSIDTSANAGTLVVCRDIDGGREKLEVNLPAVITCQKELTEPRIPNMRGIMAARSKPLKVVQAQGHPADLNLLTHALPPTRQACRYFEADQMDALVEALRQQAKVL